jgi:hypothetical protein
MVQLSRPFQIVLAAFVLFALAWFALLHRPGSGSAGSSASSSAQSSARRAAPHTPGHAGSSSSAATSHAGANALTSGGHAKASSGHAKASTGHAAHATTSGSQTAKHDGARAHSQPSASDHVHSRTTAAKHAAASGAAHGAVVVPRRVQPTQHGPAAAANHPATPSLQATVARELKQGKVALLLFWNPHSSNDSAVRRQVELVAHKLGRRVAVHTASANQVGSFGSITRDIQVYQTPTLLIVNPHAQVTTVAGYTDAYALEQAIREARG